MNGEAPDPDIVQIILQRIRELTPLLTPETALDIERELREKYGGLRVRIPKRGKYLTAEQRASAYSDGLSGMGTPAVLEKHKTSQATLYRIMKTGGRFGGE